MNGCDIMYGLAGGVCMGIMLYRSSCVAVCLLYHGGPN